MTTKPVNNQSPTSLLNTRAADAGKAQEITKSAVPGAAPKTGKNLQQGADVRISSDAKNRAESFQKALDIARATPDVREDRVADLKQRIQNGTYQIDAGNIADGMLREAIKEHLAETEER